MVTGPTYSAVGRVQCRECMGFLQVLPSLGIPAPVSHPLGFTRQETEVVANTEPISEQHTCKFWYILYGWTRTRRRYGAIQLGKHGGHCHCFGAPSG